MGECSIMGQDTTALLKKSLYEIKRLKREINERPPRVPVAVTGMACRFPGGSTTPEKFWDLLKNGNEGLRDVPPDRWDSKEFSEDNPGNPLTIYTQKLNFLAEDVSLFDSRLFAISPREAEEMDPQQRLLLELTWEALERSGYAPKSLKGQAVGVFMGIITAEYGLLPRDIATTGPHTMTGLLNSMASGRIAHSFGFHGPAVSVDTACSSSMVSIHQACKSIQDNECHTAIAGGAGLMLSPLPVLNLCKLHALSKDGRCKTFSANGDGYGRGEGAGVVVLKRLDIAQRDGDPILAVIETSNLNHDGPASGLTVPNGQAQQKLLEETLSRANIPPADIGYVELHGTGTSLGDPIEFQSLVGVFGQDRSPDNPLMLGTCKANIGHLEAAAGIASVIKTILCLQHKALPPHINCDEINPRIQLQRIPARLPDSCQHWETHDNKARRVGISSFGFSGTNAFMVIKEAPAKQPDTANAGQDRPKHILTISAQSKSALNELAGRYGDYAMDLAMTRLPSFAHTINVGRSHFSWRVACVWADKQELLSALADISGENYTGDNIHWQGGPVDSEKRVSMVFPGKCHGVFAELASLIELCPDFQKTWKRCEAAFSLYTSNTLTNLLAKHREHFLAIPLDEAAITFSATYSMFNLFQYLGVKVSTVYAEGEGVFSMAASTGMVPLDQAVNGLVRGYMDKQTHEPLAKGYEFSMPSFRVILPGSTEPLKRSQLSDPALLECADNEPVDKGDIQTMLGGHDVLVFELDTCAQIVNRIYGRSTPSGVAPCLENMSWDGVVSFVADCYSHGHLINWQRFDEGFKRERLICPTYPFQRRSYWLDTSADLSLQEHSAQLLPVDTASENPLQGNVQTTPLQTTQVLFNVGAEKLPTLSDTHYIVHIGHFLEMLISGLKQRENKNTYVHFLTFDSGLIIPEGEEKEIHLIFEEPSDGITSFSFYTPGKGGNDWNQHVHGALGDASLSHNTSGKQDFTSIKSRCPIEMSGEAFYQTMTQRGFVLGLSVRWIDQVWCHKGEALARFRLPASDENPAVWNLGVHPGVWASCFQLLHATLEEAVGFDVRFVLVGMGAIDFFQGDVGPVVWCHITSLGRPNEDGVLDGAFTLYSDSGEIVAQCHSCEMKEQAVDKQDDNKPCEGNPEIIDSLNAATSNEHQLEITVRYVKKILSELLKVPGDEIVASESISQLGMDSLVGFELRDKINKEFGVPVPVAILLQGPTPKALAEAIQQGFTEHHNAETGIGKNKPDSNNDTTSSTTYAAASREKGKWIQGKHSKSAEINLYCLPYGGGGASLYRNWLTVFPKEINVRPVQFPGRQDRILEHPVESVDEMVNILTDVLSDDLHHPYAIYGHSAGALVAYAWARYLDEQNLPKPEYLIVGGFTAPFIPSPYLGVIKNVFCEGGFEGIPTVDEFIQAVNQGAEKIKKCMARVTELTGMALHQDFERQEFSDAMLPQLVADCNLVDSFDSKNAGCLDIPIAALHGMDDDRVSIMGMRAWKSLTTDTFSVKTFPGDHFFLHPDQSEKAVTTYLYNLLVAHNQEVVLEPDGNI